MMHRLSPATTEPFFDLLPRFPHAIRILFHGIQVPFISILGYSPFALRLPSLIAGFLGLYFMYRLLRLLLKPHGPPSPPARTAASPAHSASPARTGSSIPIWITLMLAADIQFLYASRFARQEIFLFSLLILSLYFFSLGEKRLSRRFYRLAALTIGLSIGFHPNSFLISLPVGAFFLVHLIYRRNRESLRSLFEYVAILAAFATLFVALSLLMDPDFFSHYAHTGEKLGVAVPFYIKVFRFPDFYLKLFHGISGTYYTPDIRLQFVLFGAAIAASAPVLVWRPRLRKTVFSLLLGILLLNIGTLVLGKYSQPSIILHFPLYYILLAAVIEALPKPGIRRTAAVLAAAAVIASTSFNLLSHFHLLPPKNATEYESYAEYRRNIRRLVPNDAEVLANLNTAFAFDCCRLHDYRNLAYLGGESGGKAKGVVSDPEAISPPQNFAEYIEREGIEYIIYPEEMDVIYKKRPVWNILYGNVAGYYFQMKKFLEEQCSRVGSFSSPTYGMRITRYSGTRPWTVTVYRVNSRR